ncbi:hypothetical protein T02_8436 [Trichinella nativa]|uniref:Peptidase S1 domain-containing protein n=1 Tax=Trichinella nativa TaxID=6335 RepID=A0A0V1LIL3_9BILA|nr:hypothetical protein T02_8436 [Trichinella nativa]
MKQFIIIILLSSINCVSSECGQDIFSSLVVVYKPMVKGTETVMGIACQGVIVPGKHQNFSDTVVTSLPCIAEDPEEGYLVGYAARDPFGDDAQTALDARAQRIIEFPVDKNPFGILKTVTPMVYDTNVQPLCLPEVPLPNSHQCVIGVISTSALMAVRDVQMLYPNVCEEITDDYENYLCAEMLAIDGEIAEALGYSRQVAEPPVPDPIEKLLSLELASIMSPLICRTVQRQLWTFYGYAYDALDVSDFQSPVLFSDAYKNLQMIKKYAGVTYDEWLSNSIIKK